MTSDNQRTIQYTQQVIGWQPRLYAFALSLTGNADEADDVLQNTNVTLLQKQDTFREDSDFGAWAMQIAYLEVQRRRSSNAKMKQRFDDALVDQLAASAPQPAEPFDAEVHMLRKCMGQLSPSEREMLTLRYGGSSVRDIADQSGRTVGSISQTLYRIRGKLSECIKRALGAERRHET